FSQNTDGNEGLFPSTFSAGQNYWTLDVGDVSSVLTMDCAGGMGPDIIVGTRSPTAGRGTIEIWQNSDAATPTFSRQETYPSAGLIPTGTLGEVASMALADIDGDGRQDLVVTTKTGNYSGGLLIYYLDTGNIPPNGTDPSAGALANFVPALTKANFNYGVNPVSPSPPYLMDLAAGVKTGANTGALVVFIR